MSADIVKCAKCGHVYAPYEDRHRHCGGCGVLLTKGRAVAHPIDCPRVGIKPGQFCPVDGCKRLLAAGADCPVHGAPVRRAGPSPF